MHSITPEGLRVQGLGNEGLVDFAARGMQSITIEEVC